MKKLSRDINHYIPLVSILLAGFAGIYIFSYDKIFQVVIIVSVGISYIAWGIIHHHLHRDIHLSVVLEYVLIAVLGALLVSALILKGG